MSLFGGKTITTVGSVTYNMAGDATGRLNFLKSALIYLNAADQGIGEKLPRMYLKSIGMKLKRAYNYAALLPQGLPEASIQLWEYQEFENAVQTLLDVQHGVGRFKVQDAYITESGVAPAIEAYLNNTYGWDSVTGLMASPPSGFASDDEVLWYLQSGEQILDQPNQFSDPYETMGTYTAPQQAQTYIIEFRHDPLSVTPDLTTSVVLATVADNDQALLTALVAELILSTRSDTTTSRAFQGGDTNHVTTSSTVAVAGSRTTTTTTTTTYTTNGTTTTIRTVVVDSTTSEAKSMIFQLGTGQYPTLDGLWFMRSNVEQTYFPSIPFRIDNVDMLDEKYENTVEYKKRKKICTLMGLNAVAIQELLNTNENIKEIDYAFLQAGANMNTESQAEMDYLFRFWELCKDRQIATEADLNAWEALGFTDRSKPPTNQLIIKDPQSLDGAYKVSIEWDYINKTTVTGQVGPTGKIGSFEIVSGTSVTYDYTSIKTRNLMDSTVVYIRKQINATQYEQLAISGAVHKNDVYKGKTVTTLAKDARAEPEENEGFLIPLHMGIFNAMPLIKRTQFANECLYMVFNSYVKTKQKWYQTGIFKVILAIIAVVLMVFFPPAGFAIGSVVWGAAAIFTLVGSYLIANIIAALIVGYLVAYLLGKWQAGFEAVFGKKWAGVVMAIIQLVVSAYSGGSFGSSQGWLQTAVQIIDIASSLFSGYVQGATMVRQDQYDAYEDKMEEEKKRLDKLSTEFFGENDLVSVDYLLRLQKNLREDTPTTFLSRTLLVGSDVVDITLGQVSEMASMTLAPRLQGIFV